MKKKEYVHRSFAAIAQSYDLLNSLLSFGMDAWWRHKAIKALGLSGQGLVLDACAGTMRLGRGILRKWPGGEKRWHKALPSPSFAAMLNYSPFGQKPSTGPSSASGSEI
jgi:hypothetical protein